MMETCSLVQMYLTKLVLHFYFYFCSYVCLIYTVDGSSQRVPLFLLRCTYDVVSTVCVQNRKKQKKKNMIPFGTPLGHVMHFNGVKLCIYICARAVQSLRSS